MGEAVCEEGLEMMLARAVIVFLMILSSAAVCADLNNAIINGKLEAYAWAAGWTFNFFILLAVWIIAELKLPAFIAGN